MMDKERPAPKVNGITVTLIIVITSIAVVALSAYLYLQKDSVSMARTQEPNGPFPYKIEEVTFTNVKANITLSGTLTVPANDKNKYPVVILISGYGPQNRDAEWNGHKPFLLIADHLTRRGVAVLRYDDRGFGKSDGNYHTSTSLDFSTDVESAVNFLKTRDDIDSTKIGLIGHSDGAMIAPMVAVRSNDVSYIVMLAGPGIPGSEFMIERQVLWERRLGKSEAEVQRSKEYMEQLINIIMTSASEKQLKTSLEKFARETKDQIPDSEIPAGMTKEEFISRQVGMLTSPFFKFFFTYNPQDDLKKVKCPVLALCGEKDIQAPAADNLLAIKNALISGGNENVIVKELSGLNHMFQECTTGMIDEYGKIDQTFSPTALAEITQFVLQKSHVEFHPN